MLYTKLDVSKDTKYICYGAGNNATKLLEVLEKKDLLNRALFFVDNNKELHNTNIKYGEFCYSIYPIEKLNENPDAIVIITPWQSDEIVKEIKKQNTVKYYMTLNEFIAFINIKECFAENYSINTRFIVLNTPSYGNLGDHAIVIAQRDFLEKYFTNEIIEINDFSCTWGMSCIKEHVNDNDIIIITGGGNLGSIWGYLTENILNTIEDFPNNNIIIFPQSPYYEPNEIGEELLHTSQIIFAKHNNLLICVRDNDSYKRTRDYFPESEYLLVPDIVLSLKYDISSSRNGIGICLRDDKEGVLSNEEHKMVYNIVERHSNNVVYKELMINEYDKEVKYIEELTEDMIKSFARLKCVITDRLHGMVFSVITGTPCIVIDNSYKKTSSLYFTWLSKNDNIIFIDEISEEIINEAIIDVLKKKPIVYNVDSIQPYYNELIEYISELVGMKNND
jgi:pyruvyl transferase EpsI